MSRPVFLHKEKPVVKKTIAKKVEKSRNRSKGSYVNESEYPQEIRAVEKPCGKVCGECGKVAVFNRYFGFFKMRKRVYKPVHIQGLGMVATALCSRRKESFVSRSQGEKLDSFVKRV